MEETVILNFEVDQADAEKQLKRIEGVILDNRKAQQDLTKALKAGNITQEEYIEENIRLQQNLKKEQQQKTTLIKTLNTESNSRNAIKLRIAELAREYDNLNRSTETGAKRADHLEKELAQLNAQLTKGNKAAGLFKNEIGNYPQSFSQAASQIRVAGVSVGDLTTRLASFANPATAALGIVTALGSAYANSTRGAKDLEFAQGQLATALDMVSNSFAKAIGASDEDGEGFLSGLLNRILTQIDPALAAVSKIIQGIREEIEDLERDEIDIRGEASSRLEENQELLEAISNDQTKLNEKLEAANKIEENIVTNRTFVLEVLNEQLKRLEVLTKASDNNEKALTVEAQKRAEIRKEAAAFEKQLTKINKVQNDLNQQVAIEADLRRRAARDAAAPTVSTDLGEVRATEIQREDSGNQLSDPVIAASNARIEQFTTEVRAVELTEKQKQEYYRRSFELKKQLDELQNQILINELDKGVNNVRTAFGEQSTIYKVAASFQALVATYSSATKSYDSLSGIPYVGPALGAAAAAAAIAAGLANVATINGVQFAEGGWTGPGKKYDVAGVVHADEYVVPKSVNNMPQAQGHLAALERMRGGYADGGFVTNQNIAASQQALITANAFKNLPQPVVSWTEGRAVGRRVEFKERVSRINQP
jgi:chromosome segregation ATPase